MLSRVLFGRQRRRIIFPSVSLVCNGHYLRLEDISAYNVQKYENDTTNITKIIIIH